MAKPNGILEMDPAHYREIDGVVFDLDSYEKHCQPQQGQTASPEAAPESPAPSPVFAVAPYPDGWYPIHDNQPPVPIMGGALPPVEVITDGEDCTQMIQTFRLTGSSGSGSYLTSYMTSYRTSYLSSGSGSYMFGSGIYLVGGYGLELI